MESYIPLIVFALFKLIEVFSKNDEIDVFSKVDEVENLDVEKIIRQFSITWDVPSLKYLMYQQIEKHPRYEKSLSVAYDKQLKLLQGLKNKCPITMRKITVTIKNSLEKCSTIHSTLSLKKSVSGILEQIPSLNEIFEKHELKFQMKRSKNSTQNLFSECQSLEELKKRFRRLAFLNHPDRGGNPKAMQKIIELYEENKQKWN